MKKFIILFTLTWGISSTVFASHFEWVQQVMYSLRTHSPNSMVCDKAGNVVIGGNFYSCIVCPVGFLEKRNTSGVFMWQVQISNQGMPVSISEIAIDSNDNIYAAIQKTAWSDLSIAGFVIPGDDHTTFLAKFSSSGTLLWIKAIGTQGSAAVAVDPGGNAFFTNGDTLRKINTGGTQVWKKVVAGVQLEVNGSEVFVSDGTTVTRILKSTAVVNGIINTPPSSDFILLNGSNLLVTGNTGTWKVNSNGVQWSSSISGNAITRHNNSVWVLQTAVSNFPNATDPSVLSKIDLLSGALLSQEVLQYTGRAGSKNLCVDTNGILYLAVSNADSRHYTVFPPLVYWPSNGPSTNGFLLAKYLGESAPAVIGFGNSVWDPNNDYSGYWNESEIGSYRPCPGSTNFNVTYNFRSGVLQPGNVISVEMSDTNGSFNSPTVIGAIITTQVDGQIGCMLPLSASNSNNYRIRLHCTSPALYSSQTSIPMLLSSPRSTVRLSSTSTTFCSGAAFMSVYPFNANYFYTWERNGVYFSSGSTDTIIKLYANGTYNCLVQDEAGCERESDNSYSISTLPLPNATITPTGTYEICRGSSLLLSVPANAANGYEWYKGTSIVGGNVPYFSAITSGTYKVKVTGMNGCTRTSSPVKITVYKSTLTAFGSTSFCFGDSVLLGANGGGGISYQWFRNGIQIPGATSQYYSASLTGTYTVFTGNATGCESMSTGIQVTVNCRVSDLSPDEFIVLMNPVVNTLHLTFSASAIDAEIQVFDMHGRRVLREYLPKSVKEAAIDVSMLASGLYVVEYLGHSRTFVISTE